MAQVFSMQYLYNPSNINYNYTALPFSATGMEVQDAMIRQIAGLPPAGNNNLFIGTSIPSTDETVDVNATPATDVNAIPDDESSTAVNDDDEDNKKKKHKAKIKKKVTLDEYHILTPTEILKKALHYQRSIEAPKVFLHALSEARTD